MSNTIGRFKYKGEWIEGQYFYGEEHENYDDFLAGPILIEEQHMIRALTPNNKYQIIDYVLPKNKIQIKNKDGKFVKLK